MSAAHWPRQALQFLREVRSEGKKVSWPERQKVVSGSLAVLLFVTVTAAYLGLADFVIGWLLGKVLS